MSWAVHAKGQGTSIVGAAVCDVSESGVFIHPLMRENLPPQGTALGMTVFTDGFAQGLNARGVVKWVGHSSQHDCDGLGIEFEDGEIGLRLLKGSMR